MIESMIGVFGLILSMCKIYHFHTTVNCFFIFHMLRHVHNDVLTFFIYVMTFFHHVTFHLTTYNLCAHGATLMDLLHSLIRRFFII